MMNWGTLHFSFSTRISDLARNSYNTRNSEPIPFLRRVALGYVKR